jgi:hypothetical protein
MHPLVPAPAPPPPPLQPCPAGFDSHFPGVWSNAWPCGYPAVPPACPTEDRANNTAPLCAKKCNGTASCVGFEVFESTSCWLFVGALKPPFTPTQGCQTCVRRSNINPFKPARVRYGREANAHPTPEKHAEARDQKPNTKQLLPGFQVGNGTFLLNRSPIRLFARCSVWNRKFAPEECYNVIHGVDGVEAQPDV